MARLNKSGLRDWVLQRISAVVLGIYTLVILAYILAHQPLSFVQWASFNQHLSVKVLTFIVLLSILYHAWIGLWTVLTDYVKNLSLRYVLQVVILMLLLVYVGWGIEILWG